MPSDTLQIRRASVSVEEPWAIPAGCETVQLLRATDGSTPRLFTAVSIYYDDRYLNVLFSASDDHTVATMEGHDEPIYEEDVVEMFLAPERLTEYFEIEVSPLGTTFDARIASPDGVRETMRADVTWDCAGLRAGLRRMTDTNGEVTLDTLIRVPFTGLGRSTPEPDEVWRGNFFRIDRHPDHGDEYCAWRPTMKEPADFHVAAAFGALKFRG